MDVWLLSPELIERLEYKLGIDLRQMQTTLLAVHKHRKRCAGMANDQLATAKALDLDLFQIPPGDQRADKIRRAKLKNLRTDRESKSRNYERTIDSLLANGSFVPFDKRLEPIMHEGVTKYFSKRDTDRIRELQEWIELLRPENRTMLERILERRLGPNERPSRRRLWTELVRVAVAELGFGEGSCHCQKTGGFRSAVMTFVLLCSQGVVHPTLNTTTAFCRFWKKSGRAAALEHIETIAGRENFCRWLDELNFWRRAPMGTMAATRQPLRNSSRQGIQDNSFSELCKKYSARSTFDWPCSPFQSACERVASPFSLAGQEIERTTTLFPPSPIQELRSRIPVFEKSPFEKAVEPSFAFDIKQPSFGLERD